jgi:hypothetical protein
VKLYPYVVFAERMRGFDTLEEVKEFARANVPSVIYERQPGTDGPPILVEILRHNYLYDEERKEWRTMIAMINRFTSAALVS